ncbi:MAG: autotransporter outer membrane beta-barrel domain-containing protein [Pseudomonadota bacterium]
MNRQFFLHKIVSRKFFYASCRFAAALLLSAWIVIPSSSYAQSPPPPPPPPEPSDTSTIGQTVTNPVTGLTTTVSGLQLDPAGSPTVGETAFVQTADGYAFLVKDIGEFIYNNDTPPLPFEIVGPGATAGTVLLDADPPGGPTAELRTGLLDSELQAEFNGEDTPGDLPPPVIVSGEGGVVENRPGRNGSNGRPGALFVPPTEGGDGSTGRDAIVDNRQNVNTTENFGILAISRGGQGGRGGDSYLSFWDGRDGGDGGQGGIVDVTNNAGIEVATSRDGRHGIFGLSRSGRAGNGGSGFAAPGGGTGGKSSDGGSVEVSNFGEVTTLGDGAFGIYGLSVSNNGGDGGSQWGLVGESGDGGFGGSGGRVSLTNESSGTINTFGDFSHGIFAQSVGGSGGSAGSGGNLLVNLLGSADNGGNGGEVDVTNNGQIVTAGRFSRGMFAQSIGGGGGSGGGGGGLISIGGAGSGGGSAGRVRAFNNASGVISTFGHGSDGIFVQSVGGSAGAASGNGGLVAIGGSGGSAGNGGEVVARNFGSIITRGEGARGIVAQSIGGGGGDGGNTGGLIAIGGRGGVGGNGGIVRVTQGGSITTEGDGAAAIFTQSVGGGGGNGGSGIAGGPFVSVAIGGSGGDGGRGGNVEVTLQGSSDGGASVIRTDGDRSNGLFAQSVGGGGGNGGGSVSVSAGAFGALSIAVGGQGGLGGDGGLVTMSPGTGGVSVVETVGDDSTAVMLQSVGGGGGNGGYAVSVAGSLGLGASASVSVGVGGDGGGGGEGGEVGVGTFDADDNLTEVGLNGSILTTGDRSTGLLAQSVGGGGGNGGQAVSIAAAGSDGVGVAVAAGVGGSGAGGGAGGDVSVGTAGNVTTEGDASTGMLVQSVGGGGGNGGGSITGSLSVGGAAAGSVSLGIGGSAGTGNSGGNVVLATLEGMVTTSGESSTGIVAQSVGGGGGNGGYAVAVGAAGAGTGAGAVTIGLGGSGGSGGSGGEVRADLESDVDTSGDSSTGILAQSVGGGGGNGGFSVSAGIAGAGTGAGTVGVGLGGAGGSGATGGLVNASSTGAITTRGDNSSGFVAQSVGGGGGNGGFNVTGSLAASGTGAGAVSVGLGGTGGTGATGGEVTASTSGDVVTEGDRSSGIVAQSVGGGGGNGGFNVSVALSGAGTGSGAVGVGLGGSGGAGSDASTVGLTVDNNVMTMGEDSTAVVAQSVGGGGGNGGFNVSVSGSGAGTGSVAVGVGLGGSGSGGGDGDFVESIVRGDLMTFGDNSNGLLAQSVGGGGGNGGFNVAASISVGGTGSGTVGVGIGGSGAGGGSGGNVESTLTGNVVTEGEAATGIVAQSLGGGGGNGAFNVTGSIDGSGSGGGAISVGIGGAGGAGGGSGTVMNTVTGNVVTAGDAADGVLAQSLGGGGGNGGFNVSGAIAISGGTGGAVAVGIGGSGGSGGGSDAVTNTVSGDVGTSGSDSFGIVTQSIGGGGGNGAFNISGSVTATTDGSGNVGVGIGGSGGSGGDAGTADTMLVGDVTTMGEGAGGVMTQSLGGGGGNGGFNVTGTVTISGGSSGTVGVGVGGSGDSAGNAVAATSSVTGDVVTVGSDAVGITTQSVGGGGGNGGFNVTGSLSATSSASGNIGVGVGGSGGGGGNAGTADSTVVGDVMTLGDGAGGVLTQSLGGGGGNGGFNVTAGLTVSGSGAGTVGVGVGGSGDGGGTSDAVSTIVTGDVMTAGSDAAAIVSQSIGGGGGNGAFNVTGTISATSSGSANVGVGIGGSGGGGGSAGSAGANVTGDIVTEGSSSGGLLVQSLGGGGGNGGMNVTGGLTASGSGAGTVGVGVGGFGGGAGDSDTVEGTFAGNITTTGNDSYGALLQSLGGGGGNGGINVTASATIAKSGAGTIGVGVGGFGGGGGDAATVTGTIAGDVVTAGSDAFGVMAQSLGGGGGNGGLNVSGAVNLSRQASGSAALGIGGFGGGAGDGSDVVLTRSGLTRTMGSGADGVVAQSIGGGGGNGGLNVSGAIAGSSNGTALSAALGVGGFGAGGGDAGNVTANVSGDVIATGIESETTETIDGLERRVISGGSNGIVAQSVGGSGGNGGLNVSAGIAFTPGGSSGTGNALTLGIGGFGGTGGNAGNVDLGVMADNVVSMGDARSAVMAQSVGGGGGNGGINVSAGITSDAAVTVGIGGFGGGGGTAGDVTANVTVGQISAMGEAARGIVAQSVGGGGGNGGINISGGIQVNRDSDLPSVVFGMGGEGGAGNISGNVDLTQTGDILVDGVNSIGVLAQSVAGGGGNGALNVSGNLAAGGGFAGVIGVGGSAGDGADAGNVALSSDGVIDVSGIALADLDEAGEDFTSFGDRTNGILAQSVGGGGGNGGANVSGVATRGNPIAVNVGSAGGGGGNAGEVSVARGTTSAALLRTRGDQANGLTAQSIGGGGGNAGMNFQFALSGVATDDEPVSAMITIGGSGGDPGDGAATTVDHVGDIVTDGRQSVGILAQSVGGGGGNANLNIAGGFNKKSTAFNLAIGGAPGDGGDGDEVAVSHTGNIATVGDDSMAIFAQSVGGGGGNAAMNMATSLGSSNALNIAIGRVGGDGGIGGDVSVDADGMLSTEGDRAVAVLAQSVGNAGGKSGATSVGFSSASGEGESARSTGVNVAVGLEGGMGGRAGDVAVNTDGIVTTEGEEAHGIHAQSVGGGGGIGGAATNIVFRETTSVRVGVGGAGGDGGVAGEVSVANDALVVTDGSKAHGIYAQSIGGGGGTGGYAGQIAIQAGGASGNGNNSVGVSVGGSGGTGAAGDAVTVANRGVILTSGDESTGITAQSVGGGGGDGGIVVNGTLAGNGRNNAMTVGIGGAGGTGGVSADVDVTNEGVIMTSGREATGIRAQSIAGGGGNAGLLVNLDISRQTGSTASRTATMNIGGAGGSGGVAGDVTVVNRAAADGSGGMIVTDGNDAYGILAQSIGGGGGNGSSIINGRFAQDNNTSGRNATLMSLNVGGFGGDGGVAGNVTVDNETLIDTTGENAHGVFAQSIGGGGGNGGMVLTINKVIGSAKKAQGAATQGSDKMLSVGGVGGNGGDAGAVVVNNSGQIVTRGENAHGVFAQSVGGGGGNTGWKVGGNSNKFVTGVVGKIIGAFGGDGGLGGEVTVNHSGDISVFGDGAQAIKAESINGGGGTTAIDFNGIAGVPGGAALPEIPGVGPITGFEDVPVLELRIGGEQQEDASAENVTLNNTGTFGVFGDNGAGNGSMAVGGGGGTASVNVNLGVPEATDEELAAIDVDVELGGLDGQNNAGGDLDSRHDGDILSMGRNSHGVAIQSIGGGGGRANYAFSGDGSLLGELSYRLGGTNGSNEAGGSVEHRQTGNVVTEGDLSHGLLVSSVGGGGGTLSLSFDFDEPAPAAPDTDDPQPMAAHLGATGITLGSNGGNALDGGNVALNHNGGIATTGDLSTGLILQSIGSGGGEVRVQGAENLNVTLGGSGGATGDGGDIELFVRDTVNTAGDRSHGVMLQSIGGGGGAVFTDIAPASVLFSADNSGDGGAISAVFLRDIVTQGDNANGVIAQSLGGGGGFIDGTFFGSAGGSGAGDAVDLEIAGDIFAMGAGSSAILAQSLGSDGGGDIRLSLSADRTLLGGVGGTAITMQGGAENTVINRGLITTMEGIDGLAVLAGAGNDTILNEGELVGNLSLGDGTNAVNNTLDALFESGASVDLGNAESTLTNAGVMAPGGRNLAQASALNGSFVQTDTGVFESELDFLSDSLDALTATGSIDTAGDLVLSLLNTQVILPGEFTRTLFGGAAGYTNSGVNFETAPSVVVTYDLLESSNALDLAYAVDFSPTGLGDNRTSTGDYFNRVQLAGSTEALADTIIRLVAIGELEEYRNVMTQLSPEIYAEQQAQTLASAQSFLRNVRERCTTGDAYSNEAEDECVWLRYDVQDMDRDGGLGSPQITGDGRRYAFGWQYRRPDDSLYGIGVALDDTDFSGFDERWTTQGRSWQLSAIGELPMRNNQAMVLQAGLGQTSYETRRRLDVTEAYLAEADSDVVFLSGQIGFLDRRTMGRFRFEQGVDFGFAHLRGNSLSETGASEQNLIVDGRSDNYFWVKPSVEVSTGSILNNNVKWEVFGRAGLQHYISDPNTTSIGRLSGGPVGTAGMGNEADLDSTHGIFGIGLRATSGNLRFSLSYEADESSNRSVNGVNGKLIFTF